MNQINKVVLTGGPGVGKSTVIDILKRKGRLVIPEMATMVITEELQKGGKKLPWIDRNGFQLEVMRRQLEFESKAEEGAKPGEMIFLDRGIADGLAYYKNDRIQPPQELLLAAAFTRYHRILVLDPLPMHENTETRREDMETAKKLHELMIELYKGLGYNLIRIEACEPEARARLVEKYGKSWRSKDTWNKSR